MYVIITGQDCQDIAELTRNELSSKGVACIVYDYEEPAKQMHDGAIIALQQYSSYDLDMPIKNVFDEPKDENLVTLCRAWRGSRLPLHAIAKSRLGFMTKRWDELGMLYFAIVFGDLRVGESYNFPGAYKVLVEKNEKGHVSTVKLNDFAGGLIFDQVVDLNELDSKSAAAHIAASLRAKIVAAFEKAPDISVPEKSEQS